MILYIYIYYFVYAIRKYSQTAQTQTLQAYVFSIATGMASHSPAAPWDDAPADADPAAPWDLADSSGDEEELGGGKPPPSHGDLLAAHLISLYISRKLSSMDACIAMHHASLAGVAQATSFAKPLGLATGRYSDHLKSALGYRSDNSVLYAIPDSPCKLPGVMGHGTDTLVVMPGHEPYEEYTTADAGILRNRLQSHKDKGQLS